MKIFRLRNDRFLSGQLVWMSVAFVKISLCCLYVLLRVDLAGVIYGFWLDFLVSFDTLC